MDEFSKNIENIRKLMEDMKFENYAVNNPAFADMEEYVKSLYLKILCTLIQYDNVPCDMQIKYLKRIVSGGKVEFPAEEYMRRALEISAADIQEFIGLMKESSVKYYFTLEAIILVSLGKAQKINYEYMAEIVELIEIGYKELRYVMTVVKSVLQQSSEIYEEAKGLITDEVKHLNFSPYIQNFYAGVIIDSETEKYYYSPEKQFLSILGQEMRFKERKVTFDHIKIDINETWTFDGCEEVVFRNCEVNGKSGHFHFDSVGKVIMEDSVFRNFNDRVAYIIAANQITINGNEFIECGYTGDGAVRGGVIFVCNIDNGSLFLNNNSLLNCYVKAETNRLYYGVTGVFVGMEDCMCGYFELKGNDFIGCRCINNGGSTEAIIEIEDYYDNERIEENNYCSGTLTRIFSK